MKRIADAIDAILRRVGDIFAWAVFLLMIAIVLLVVLQYFQIGSIKLEELQWHLYAMAMMVGMSYTMSYGTHIRVDVLQHRFSKKTKSAIDIAGTILLLFPFLAFLFLKSLPYVAKAMEDHERSNAPSGLPWRWVIKSFIPLGCVLMALAGLAHLFRCIIAFRKKR
jgi:TRAP-type mannitol/chloroaromatic compound transport system permease small subunit